MDLNGLTYFSKFYQKKDEEYVTKIDCILIWIIQTVYM